MGVVAVEFQPNREYDKQAMALQLRDKRFFHGFRQVYHRELFVCSLFLAGHCDGA